MLARHVIPAEKRSRRILIDSLKQDGPQDAASLARRLGVSAMAVRQHLYDLEAEGLVTHEAEARPVGRPAKLWRLTPAADRFFPDVHAELTVSLINSMKQTFGAEGLDKLLNVRAREQVIAYKARLDRPPSLSKQLRELAEIRTEDGYLAAVSRAKGGPLLAEKHCPVGSADAACTRLSRRGLEVFGTGPGDKPE